MEQQNRSSTYLNVSTITFFSLCIQIVAYGWLWSEFQESSGPMGGLFIIPLVAIVFCSILIHLILFVRRKQLFTIPFVASILFWSFGLGIPYLVAMHKDKLEQEETRAAVNAIDSQFRGYVDSPLRKRYGDSITYIEGGGLEILSAKETLTVAYSYGGYGGGLSIILTKRMDEAPADSDTAFWLNSIELIRPLLSGAESSLLDSIRYAKAIRISNNKESMPGYPLEVIVEFNCGRAFLIEFYKEADTKQQFSIEYYPSKLMSQQPTSEQGGPVEEEMDH